MNNVDRIYYMLEDNDCNHWFRDNADMLRLAEYLDKKGCIAPPCKVGDTVYKVSFVHKNIIPLNVEGFICNLSSWKVHCTHLIPSWKGNQKEHIYISFSSFGKTAFRFFEESERALKGGEG